MKVFLGGTCNGSEWRDRVIPMLTVGFFNPVVPDWTPECMEEELRQREVCDVCLYVITPKMTGVYSVAEVIDDSNKRPSKTVLVVLRDDGNDRFSDAQWKSLDAVSKMVVRNGGATFDTLEGVAAHINNRSQVEASAVKTLHNSDVSGARMNVPDIKVVGNGDTFRLLCKASSQREGWMKSSKAMEVPGGCVVQATTQQRNPDGSYAVAEALTFVPGVKIADDVNGGRKLVAQ